MRQTLTVIVGGSMLAVAHGCGAGADNDLPPVAEIVGYDVVQMDWPWCAVEPPPIRSDFDVCPISEIGEQIDQARVCRLVVGLKAWMENPPSPHPAQLEPGDWHRIRSIIVCGWGIPTIRTSSEGDEAEPVIHIEADVPERPRLYWADLEEAASPSMRFGVTHR